PADGAMRRMLENVSCRRLPRMCNSLWQRRIDGSTASRRMVLLTCAHCGSSQPWYCGCSSVDECPGVRAIEMADLNRLLKTRIKVVEVDAVLATGFRREWLP